MAKGAAKKAHRTNAKRTTTPPTKDAFKVGAHVVYLGGSRCAWLNKGQQGVVARYHVNPGGTWRYGVDFQCKGKTRTTQLATKYVKAGGAR